MGHDLMDDLDRRLRAARPAAARPADDAVDTDLLALISARPIAGRRAVPRAVALPVAVGVTLTATAALMLFGGPGNVGAPSAAAAIEQTLRWFDAPADGVLHARSVETQGGRTTVREAWQSGDDPQETRVRIEGASTVETSGATFYDPSTDTLYDPGLPSRSSGPQHLPAGDPVVQKVRFLLQEGHMTVTGREVHDGTDAWVISLDRDAGRPVWTLWVSAADGRPLELRDPGRDASEPLQVIRWSVYEVLRGDNADDLVSLGAAHPSARVERDPDKVAAAERRLGIVEG
ncbi:MAG: hypothetical protein QOH13_1569 [Thermoleophilaceae bacterium]|nr:hypothetical protein [Thermoleophilaceae bacterium]